MSAAVPGALRGSPPRSGVRFPPWGALGVLLFALGLWALIADLEAWNTIWYLPAWYGYLLAVDAAISLRRGSSFVVGRRRELVSMMFWSLPFWLLFEAYNLRLHNWYYVFGLRTIWGSGLMSTLAFATVLPACFFHAEALEAFGAFRRARSRPLRITPRMLSLLAALGAFCAIAPLLWPRMFFWAVWGATLGIPEVWNYRAGAPSLIGDLEAGRPGRLLRLLFGGLWAGAVWELLNFWARTKWIYTVPGFEDWKVFEMPLAGFGGFPPLAVSAFAFFTLVSRLAKGRRIAAAALAVVFTVGASIAILDRNVQSMRPVLSDLSGLDASAARKLRASGIPTPELLERAVRREGTSAVASRAGIPLDRVERAAREASLALHKGMGAPAAHLLEAAGVEKVSDLAPWDPAELTARLSRIAAARREPAPRPEYVRVWVRAAKLDGRPRR